MNLKLKYDPKRTIRLRKNEILDELRIKFSQKIYEVFKIAEGRIWSGSDQDFQFIDDIVNQLQSELGLLKSDLTERAQAWANVEQAENPNSRKLAVKPARNSNPPAKVTKKPPEKSEPQEAQINISSKDQTQRTSPSFLPEPDFDIPPQKSGNSPKTPLQPFEEDEFDFFEEL